MPVASATLVIGKKGTFTVTTPGTRRRTARGAPDHEQGRQRRPHPAVVTQQLSLMSLVGK
jgi:hypothetical protein